MENTATPLAVIIILFFVTLFGILILCKSLEHKERKRFCSFRHPPSHLSQNEGTELNQIVPQSHAHNRGPSGAYILIASHQNNKNNDKLGNGKKREESLGEDPRSGDAWKRQESEEPTYGDRKEDPFPCKHNDSTKSNSLLLASTTTTTTPTAKNSEKEGESEKNILAGGVVVGGVVYSANSGGPEDVIDSHNTHHLTAVASVENSIENIAPNTSEPLKNEHISEEVSLNSLLNTKITEIEPIVSNLPNMLVQKPAFSTAGFWEAQESKSNALANPNNIGFNFGNEGNSDVFSNSSPFSQSGFANETSFTSSSGWGNNEGAGWGEE